MHIAVTGAAGRMGHKIVDSLAANEEHAVTAVSRRPIGGLPANVSTALADYSDPMALQRAFHGVDTLVFISSDGPAANVILHHQNVVHAATASGVGHVVALSGVDADLASPFCYAVTNGRTEQLLRNSDMPYSIVRASIYSEFFHDAFLEKAKTSGEIRVPAADSRISLVSRDDVADALTVRALNEPTGRHHDITGPHALDGNAIAAAAEDAWGLPVAYADITPEQFALDMAADQTDPWWAYAFASMFASIREQRWDVVSHELEPLTGRPATPFSTITQRYVAFTAAKDGS